MRHLLTLCLLFCLSQYWSTLYSGGKYILHQIYLPCRWMLHKCYRSSIFFILGRGNLMFWILKYYGTVCVWERDRIIWYFKYFLIYLLCHCALFLFIRKGSVCVWERASYIQNCDNYSHFFKIMKLCHKELLILQIQYQVQIFFKSFNS